MAQVLANNETKAVAFEKLPFKDQMKAYERGRVTSLWLNRATTYEQANGQNVKPMTVYRGETLSGFPTWNEPVADMNKMLDGINYVQNSLRSGSKPDLGKMQEDPFYPEWQSVAQEYADALNNNNRLRSAAVGTDSDFSAIDVINVMSEMVNTELRTFVLEQALTTIGTPNLNINIDTYTRFQAESGVPEGVMPTTKRAGVSRIAYNLIKDVATIAMTDEAQLRLVHDLWRQQIDTAVTDFKRLKAHKIAVLLGGISATTGAAGGWAPFTTDHNTNSPFTDIGAAADIIFANNGAPNVLASNDKTWRMFSQSTYVKGVLQAIPLPDMSLAKILTAVPGLPGFTWYIDNEMTTGNIAVFDRRAVAMLQGPVRTAQYRLELEGVDGYVYRDWNLPIIMVPGRTAYITGVAV